MSAADHGWRPNATQLFALDLLRAHRHGMVGGNRVHHGPSCPMIPTTVARVLLEHGAAVLDDPQLPLIPGALIRAAE